MIPPPEHLDGCLLTLLQFNDVFLIEKGSKHIYTSNVLVKHLNGLGNFPISLHTKGYDTSYKNKEK